MRNAQLASPAADNYGDIIFEKNVGEGSPLKIPRGQNALWTKGGLKYAPPIRQAAAVCEPRGEGPGGWGTGRRRGRPEPF